MITPVAGSDGQYGFSGDGGAPADIRPPLAGPQGVAVAGDGDAYVADRYNKPGFAG